MPIERKPPARPMNADAKPLTGLRILVVEDEMMVAMLLEDIITGLGCEVVGPAAREAEAMRLITTNRIDAAILDVNLGEGDSYEVARMLANRKIPFTFATGYGRPAGGTREFAREILTKPFTDAEVEQVLLRLLIKH
jgi:CheY-like chemotaxis protein